MNDAQLAALAEEYDRLKSRAERAKAAKEKVGGQLLKEMERRKTEGISTHGWKITYVQQEQVVYFEEQLRRRLRKKFNLITKEVVDKDKLSAAVQEGLIDPGVVAACAEAVPKAPYVLVTKVKP